MKFCVLASGSRGNAIWVEEDDVAILLDCGLPLIQLKTRAKAAGLTWEKLAAVFVSHEHRDHFLGLGPLCRKEKIPAFVNQGTKEALTPLVGPSINWQILRTGDVADCGPLKVRTIAISHDTSDPVAFRVEGASGASLGLATDMGEPTNLVRQHFKGLDALVLEFNHDYQMLMNGRYPWPVKQRVRSRTGHLSNEVAARLAAELHHQDLKHLILAHLSAENNAPNLAHQAAQEAIGTIEPIVASQDEPSLVFDLSR